MYQQLSDIIQSVSHYLYSYLLIFLLLFAGLYFSIRTRFVQLRLLGASLRLVTEPSPSEHTVSPFQALMVSTASRVGTGNIVGVANAIAIGGYGAVFWMWVIALLGGASAFVESTLAQIYKKKDGNGGSFGGPAYYIEALMGKRWLGVVFSIALIATYAVGFNMLCSFNLVTSLAPYRFYGDPETSAVPLICGAALGILVALCLFGGGKRIIKITGILVPVMGVAYIGMALITIFLNLGNIPMVLREIFVSAFDFQAMAGGFSGSALMQGVKRGLFSNEAGVGSGPNAAATAAVSHPVKQGLVQMLSVFIDTLLVCTATAMMCLSSGITPSPALSGAPFVQAALAVNFGSFGYYFITLSLLLFAFTTLLGNLYYCEGCVRYIINREPSNRTTTLFNLTASLIVFVGALLDFGLVWNLADILMGIMALINLPVILCLFRPALSALRDYTLQQKEGKDPIFQASSIGLSSKTDFWNE